MLQPPAYPPTATPGPWKSRKLNPSGGIIRHEGWEIFTPNYDVACWREHAAPFRKETDAVLAAAAPLLATHLFDLVQLIELGLPIGDQILLLAKDALATAGIDLNVESDYDSACRLSEYADDPRLSDDPFNPADLVDDEHLMNWGPK
jgi:hypothetical protein